jgi:transcriptional regulator with XRE-family HTH domain
MSTTNNLIKDQAVSLLIQGLSTSQVAAACGVSDSYISQLRQEPEIAASLAAAGVELTIADLEFDSRLEKAESLALERIEKSIGFANMGQALSAFRILNTARKRQDSLPGTQQAGNVTVNVNLTLPAVASARYVTNSANEIVEVEGKTMISATAKSLDAILLARAGGTTTVPALTGMEKAATMLDNMRPPVYRAPRRLPTELSADVL